MALAALCLLLVPVSQFGQKEGIRTALADGALVVPKRAPLWWGVAMATRHVAQLEAQRAALRLGCACDTWSKGGAHDGVRYCDLEYWYGRSAGDGKVWTRGVSGCAKGCVLERVRGEDQCFAAAPSSAAAVVAPTATAATTANAAATAAAAIAVAGRARLDDNAAAKVVAPATARDESTAAGGAREALRKARAALVVQTAAVVSGARASAELEAQQQARKNVSVAGLVLTALCRPTAAQLARLSLARRQLAAAGYAFHVAVLRDADAASAQDAAVLAAVRQRVGAAFVRVVGPAEIARSLPQWYGVVVPLISGFRGKHWQWAAADIFPLVWWDLYGRTAVRGTGKGQMWLLEQDVGWSHSLGDMLRTFEERAGGGIDVMGCDCTAKDTSWDHWGERSRHADFGLGPTLATTAVYGCQLPLIRQSARLLQRAHDFYARGMWAYCEMTAPSLAAGQNWGMVSLQQLAPELFGDVFEWWKTLTEKQFKQRVAADEALAHGRLFHRLKF